MINRDQDKPKETKIDQDRPRDRDRPRDPDRPRETQIDQERFSIGMFRERMEVFAPSQQLLRRHVTN